MKTLLILLMAVCFGLIGCSQNSRKGAERGGTPVQPAAPAVTDTTAIPHELPGAVATTADELAPEVAAVYSGIIVNLVDVNTHEAISVTVPFGETVMIEGTEMSIAVNSFFPDFVMSETGYATRTMDENNPAAKVTVTGGDQEFSGWLFKLYPDMHPFENPDYDILLESGIRINN